MILNKNQLFFIKCSVTHKSKVFLFSVFCRTTFNSVFTNFHSFIFESYKTDFIFPRLFCCFTICSDLQSFPLEVDQLQQIFKCNNYPATLIDQSIKTFFNKIFAPKRILITVPKKRVFNSSSFFKPVLFKLKM